MDEARSYEFDQFALLQIRKGFPHIGAKHLGIAIVLFSQRLDNPTHCSSIAAGNNLLSGFV
jgi:hypothetical protein